MFRPNEREAPLIMVDLDRPGKPPKDLMVHAKAEDFSASTEKCDVRVRDNYFRGDLHTYQIRVADQDLTVEVELVGQVPPWRHNTGHIYFGEHDERVFGWLPSVPQGKVTATITEGDTKPQKLTGIGYHDHNWGDVAMSKLFNHWYWGRGQAGPYSIISSYLYAEKEYGREEIPEFMLAKDGKLVADDASKIKFSLEDVFTDEKTKKPVANRVIYDYKEDDTKGYRVTYQRSQTILDAPFANMVTGFKHILARMARIDSAYLRFSGTVSVERYVGDKAVEQASDPGIWELMYFGHVE